MTRGGAAYGKAAKPEPPGLADRLKALGRSRKVRVLLVVVVILAGMAWVNGGEDTWITVAPAPEMSVAVGSSQTVRVALKRKPPLLWRGAARSIPGTIQLISFPSAVDVVPTTVVTTQASPEAVMKVTGLKAGTEELDFAASNTPADRRSWRTEAIRVVVAGKPK